MTTSRAALELADKILSDLGSSYDGDGLRREDTLDIARLIDEKVGPLLDALDDSRITVAQACRVDRVTDPWRPGGEGKP